ncbi:hypothetical protein ID866_6920 [Astraeus odoratus]|nr:hypothetical protein ID866_6920 [Astraeus odoratus]
MAVRAAERRLKREEEEQRVQAEAEWLVRQEAEQKKEEEAQRAEEVKWRAKEAMRAAEVQRRTMEGQCKPSVVIPAGGSMHRSMREPETPAQVHSRNGQRKVNRLGVAHKWRRTQTKEDDGEDNKEDNEDDGEGDFAVLPALAQEHRDMLSTLTMTLSVLLKEFRGYCHDQWDLQARQVRGLKALQKEMKKANALKAKELEISTKGKEKAVELSEELSESSEEEEEVEDGNEGGVAEDEGDNRDGDMEMGAAPSASIM